MDNTYIPVLDAGQLDVVAAASKIVEIEGKHLKPYYRFRFLKRMARLGQDCPLRLVGRFWHNYPNDKLPSLADRPRKKRRAPQFV